MHTFITFSPGSNFICYSWWTLSTVNINLAYNKYLNILYVLISQFFFKLWMKGKNWFKKKKERVGFKGFIGLIDEADFSYKLVGSNMADLWKQSITVSAQWLLTMANNCNW